MQPSKSIWEQALIKTELKVVCMLFMNREQSAKTGYSIWWYWYCCAEDCCLMEMCHNFSIGLCIIAEAAFYIWSYIFFSFCFVLIDLLKANQKNLFGFFFVSDTLSVNYVFLFSVFAGKQNNSNNNGLLPSKNTHF